MIKIQLIGKFIHRDYSTLIPDINSVVIDPDKAVVNILFGQDDTRQFTDVINLEMNPDNVSFSALDETKININFFFDFVNNIYTLTR